MLKEETCIKCNRTYTPYGFYDEPICPECLKTDILEYRIQQKEAELKELKLELKDLNKL